MNKQFRVTGNIYHTRNRAKTKINVKKRRKRKKQNKTKHSATQHITTQKTRKKSNAPQKVDQILHTNTQ
jgi:hypothetical protein